MQILIKAQKGEGEICLEMIGEPGKEVVEITSAAPLMVDITINLDELVEAINCFRSLSNDRALAGEIDK